jgi:hypothetical protein
MPLQHKDVEGDELSLKKTGERNGGRQEEEAAAEQPRMRSPTQQSKPLLFAGRV